MSGAYVGQFPAGIPQASPNASDTVEGLIEIATQAEQETGTDVVRAVTPGRQHFHPSAAKAWVKFDAVSGTPAIVESYGVSSITDNGVGLYTVNFATAFASAGYAVVSHNGSGATGDSSYNSVAGREATTAPTTSAYATMCRNSSTGAASDGAIFGMAFYGDQ